MAVTHTYSLISEGLSPQVRVVGFRGHEAISRLYRVELFLQVPEAEAVALDPRALLGRRATLLLNSVTHGVRRAVHGVWSSVSLLRAVPGGDALYRCVLSPKLWRLSLHRRSRVFVGKTLLEIARSMLLDAGFAATDFAFEIENPARYTPLDHACQYRETDLDFLCRRLEHEGVYFYFQHPRDGHAEKLVVTDSRSFATPVEPGAVPFLATDTPASGVEGARALSCEYAAVPTNARVTGYNYLTPSVPVTGESLDGTTSGVDSVWEPARVEGARLATVRAEAMRAQQSVLEGQGRVFTACAGHTLTLDGHSMLHGEYLVTGARFQGCNAVDFLALSGSLALGAEAFDVTFTAIPVAVQFRPPRETPWPRVHGFELGVVQGPTAQTRHAEVDDKGRYLVRMMFDEDTRKPAASARLRMLQPHGGAGGMGFHFPLRNGTEVLVSFLGGDPDAPVIAGVAPNANMPSPVDVTNATKNVVQTGGGSRLEIEDQDDAQAVDWSTPYKNTRLHLGAAQGAQRYEIAHTTEGSGLVDVGVDWVTKVGGNQRENVAGLLNVDVGGDVYEVFRANHVTGVLGDRENNVHGSETLLVAGSRTDTVKGTLERNVTGEVTDNYAAKWTINAQAKEENITNERKVNTGADYSVTMGANFELFLGAKADVNVAESASVNVGLTQEFNATGSFEMSLGVAIGIGVGVALETFSGLKAENFNGTAIEITTGMKAGFHFGVTAETEALSVEWGQAKGWQKGLCFFL